MGFIELIWKIKDDVQANDEDLLTISSNLEYTRQKKAALVTEGIEEIKVIESKGQITDYYNALKEEEKRIMNILTGQTLASEEGKYGSKAQATVQRENLLIFAREDAKKLLYSLNRSIVKWLLSFNKINHKAYLELNKEE